MWTKIIKRSTLFGMIFFSSSEKLTFEKKCDFFNTCLNFYLFYLIVVIFFVNFVHMNVQNFRYIHIIVKLLFNVCRWKDRLVSCVEEFYFFDCLSIIHDWKFTNQRTQYFEISILLLWNWLASERSYERNWKIKNSNFLKWNFFFKRFN